MLRIKAFIPFLVLLIFLSSCGKSLPEELPDIGVSVDDLELNTYLTLTVRKEATSFKPGTFVILNVVNNSEYEWSFDITQDILIYEYKDKDWIKVSDQMEDIGATKVILEPKGSFPGDSMITTLLPDVEVDQPTTLRIIVLVHRQAQEKENQIKGAYVDVVLRP